MVRTKVATSHEVVAPGVCVAPDRAAAEAGAAILRSGGNAFDAVVAAGFVEAVVAPAMCGIGGYGASGIGWHATTGKVVAIDANTIAPQAATATLFPTVPTRDPNGYRLVDDRIRKGPLAVAVPGVLGGLLTMLETWGTRTRGEVMAAAIGHAREGVVLTPGMALTWRKLEAEALGHPAPERLAERDRGPIAMSELADSLEAIVRDGSSAFYRGRIGPEIARQIQARGGILTEADLAAYSARIVEPVSLTVRGHRLVTPPPGAGGLTSLQIVRLLDWLERAGHAGQPGRAEGFAAFLETIKVAWEDRLTTLADPRSMPRPPASYLESTHLDRLFDLVERGLKAPQPGRLIAPDPLRGTVHLAAADRSGNVVAWTQTHGGGFGAQVMIAGTGIVLGHGMCRFEPRPGWPNSVAPGRSPLHNMCPALVLRDGKPVLAIGASGGRTIVNNVAAVIADVVLFGRQPTEALGRPRLQCETLEPATVERAAGEETLRRLETLHHTVKPVNRDGGSVHLISRSEDDRWLGAAEPRLARAAALGSEGSG